MNKPITIFEISKSDEIVSLIITPSLAESLRDHINVYLRCSKSDDDEKKIQISFHGKLAALKP